ncbi:MAG: CotH kinase family protein [Eubacteriales bacterium]
MLKKVAILSALIVCVALWWILDNWDNERNELNELNERNELNENNERNYANSNITIYINEIMSNNKDFISDEEGDYQDYIEIYNYGNQPIQLEGFSISDNIKKPNKWTFPEYILEPNEYLLVWASGKDKKEIGNPFHTNFAINKEGEEVILTDSTGNMVQYVIVEPMPENISYGRYSNLEYVHFEKGTPNEDNNAKVIENIDKYFPINPPKFSKNSGFYKEPFSLELISDKNESIYYTLDGSEPTKDDILYTEPIEITQRVGEPNQFANIEDISFSQGYRMPLPDEVYKGTVIRAKAFRDGYESSEIITKSFFIDEENNNRYSLPVLSIVSDPKNLFSQDKGIYVLGDVFNEWKRENSYKTPDGDSPANYNQRGKEWERKTHVEYFTSDDDLGFELNLGLRVNGGWTRANARKSLKFYPRKEYDQEKWIRYPVFSGLSKKTDSSEPVEDFKRLVIRTSGNDWEYTLFRDALMQSLMEGTSVDTQAYQPVIVFLNGEYWGIHMLREVLDQHYIETHYNIDEDDVVILEGNAEIYEGEESDRKHYLDMVDYIRNNDMSNDENYEHVKTLMDVENFMEYNIAQIYYGNTDWPGNNIKFWRYRTDEYDPDAPYGHDGRWRWLLYDTDFGFGLYNSPVNHNTLEFATKKNGDDWPNPDWSTVILRSLLNNKEFRNQFINTFVDYLNTRFSTDVVKAKIKEFEEILSPEIQEHTKRWKCYNFSSESQWKNNINSLYSFAENRPEKMLYFIREYFDLTTEELN